MNIDMICNPVQVSANAGKRILLACFGLHSHNCECFNALMPTLGIGSSLDPSPAPAVTEEVVAVNFMVPAFTGSPLPSALPAGLKGCSGVHSFWCFAQA